MATIASNVEWGSSPTNTFDFSYEKKREGSSQYYKITVSCDPCTGASYFGYPIYLEIKLAGSVAATKTLKNASPSQWTSAISYTTGWLEVPNKTQGTTALAIRIYSGLGSSRNTTYSYSLAVDPAASKISATDANIESTSTISITRYDAGFTTTVSYKAAGQSSYTTIWTKQKHSSYGWTVPSSLYDLIPKAREIEITLRCQTYSGSTLIGEETCTMTATTNATKCAPVVSVSSKDINSESTALTGDNKSIISGISNLQVVTTATAKNSATISSMSVYCGGTKKTGADVTFSGATSAEVYVIVTDSRGYATRVDDTSLALIGYIAPTIIPEITRDTPTGDTVTVSVKGRWYKGSLGSVANTLRIQVKYKISDAESYGNYVEVPVTANGNEYTATVNLSGLTYTNAYSFQIRLDDAIYTDANGYRDARYAIVPLSKGIPVFDWGENDFRFNVPVNMGDVELDYIVEQGTSGIWTYRKWNSGRAECWGRREVEVNVTSSWGTTGFYYGTIGTINFPFKFAEVPAVNVTVEYGADSYSLFVASCGFSSVNYARPIMLCRNDSRTVNCILIYQVFGNWK